MVSHGSEAVPIGDSTLQLKKEPPQHQRFLKHLFCLESDVVLRGKIQEIAGNCGIKGSEPIDRLMERIRGEIQGDSINFHAKNEWKRDLLESNPKRFAVLNGREDASHTLVRYREEAKKLGMPLDEYKLDQLTIQNGVLDGIPDIELYDAFFLTSPETFSSDSAPILRLRQEVLAQLAALKPILPSPESDFEARDKIRNAVLFREYDVPHPVTIITSSVAKAVEFIKIEHARGNPVVIKPIGKGGGWGITWIPPDFTHDQVLDLLGKYLWWYGAGVVLLQEFIPNTGFDKRVLIIDELILGTMKRQAGSYDQSWVYNISKGAVGTPTTLNPEEREVALKAFHATKQVISGVDLLQCTNGVNYVLETNSCPGFAGFEGALQENVAHFILTYFSLFK